MGVGGYGLGVGGGGEREGDGMGWWSVADGRRIGDMRVGLECWVRWPQGWRGEVSYHVISVDGLNKQCPVEVLDLQCSSVGSDRML